MTDIEQCVFETVDDFLINTDLPYTAFFLAIITFILIGYIIY